MNETQLQLLQLVACALFEQRTSVSLMEEIIEEAKHQAVQGLIDPNAYQVFATNVKITKAHAELCDLLEGIPFVTIKGCASAYYYPEPSRRTMGDVDFFVDQKDFAAAEKKLEQDGFTFDHETKKHRCFRKAGISYEMHCVINGALRDNAVIQQLLADLIQASALVEFKNAAVRIPDDFHNGLICLLHFCRHLSASEAGLRQICDWACIVNRVSDFEEVFRETFEQAGLWTCARILSLTAVKYLGLPYQSWMGSAEDSVIDALMEEVMASGNMGRKRTDYETEWFVDRDGSGSGAKGIIKTLNGVTKEHWPIAAKCPVLYPAGWVFFSARYGVRMLTGKRRKIDFAEVSKRADRKNQLLESLQLFFTEQ